MPSMTPLMMQLSPEQVEEFREAVWGHYRQYGRKMPWREDPSPYKVLVSELMLQQTQVNRVIPKFNAFIYTCADFASLAGKPLGEVLALWSGLGYNRRAKYLHQTAQIVMAEFSGQLPSTRAELVKLPGIGAGTAGAILAYAYNQPVVFVETNIRTVYFHHFFADTTEPVADTELRRVIEQTLEPDQPREWYWALMDYGAYLKKTAGGRLTSSAHYVKQSPLTGSVREMRGRILKALVAGPMAQQALFVTVAGDDRFAGALKSLQTEGFVAVHDDTVGLTGWGQTS